MIDEWSESSRSIPGFLTLNFKGTVIFVMIVLTYFAVFPARLALASLVQSVGFFVAALIHPGLMARHPFLAILAPASVWIAAALESTLGLNE